MSRLMSDREYEWAHAGSCTEKCNHCGKEGNWFQYDEDAIVHLWLCEDCFVDYTKEKNYGK